MKDFNAAASAIRLASEIDWGLPVQRQMRLTDSDSKNVGSITMASVGAAEAVAIRRHKTEDAFLVWVDLHADKLQPCAQPGISRGSIEMTDLGVLGPDHVCRSTHAVLFHLPRSVVDDYCDRSNQPRLRGFHCAPGTVDPVLAALAEAVLPTLSVSGPRNQRFLDHVDAALLAHLGTVYGQRTGAFQSVSRGLSPWQEKRAKELLASGLQGEMSVEDVAHACRLSRGHFSKAFRESTGLAPHAWLVQHRLHNAKRLLSDSHSSVADIALACGFSDQSHLTRMFSRLIGIPPATWRRQQA